jgi:hypothetical protein
MKKGLLGWPTIINAEASAYQEYEDDTVDTRYQANPNETTASGDQEGMNEENTAFVDQERIEKRPY